MRNLRSVSRKSLLVRLKLTEFLQFISIWTLVFFTQKRVFQPKILFVLSSLALKAVQIKVKCIISSKIQLFETRKIADTQPKYGRVSAVLLL